MAGKPDHIKEAIEGKIFLAIAPKNWKTLRVDTAITDKGVSVAVAVGTTLRVYQITVKEVRMKK